MSRIEENFMVAVRCYAYNQEKYITNALDGFTMQQTEFPFICCIVDDSSSDGTKDVLNRYIDDNFIIYSTEETPDYSSCRARHRTNKQCFFMVMQLKFNHYSVRKSKLPYLSEWMFVPYQAICEGDDYWVDSAKLQKQYDYMESHPMCSMCFTNAIVTCDVAGLESTVNMYSHLEERDYCGSDILASWTVPTASVFYRSSFPPLPKDKRFIYGDIVLFMHMASCGSVHCINEKTVAYRRNAGGLSVKKVPFEKMLAHYDAILEHFGDQYSGTIVKLKAKVLVRGFLSGHLKSDSWRALFVAMRSPGLFAQFVASFFPILFKSL